MRLLPALLAAALFAPPSAAQLPWEWWKDPLTLAARVPGDQVLLRSSACPSGCRYDRTSDGDTRFLRVDGDEQVLYEEKGAGAIVRIWMTQGNGRSEPLDPSIRLRIRLDGEEAPRVDLPLPDVFRGDVTPFLSPLVADRLVSSGGNVSYVPIPYRKGCRVSLTGAAQARIWFQLTFHRLASPEGVTTFTVGDDLSALARLLARPGEDPWPGEGEIVSSTAAPDASGLAELLRVEGQGTLTALRLQLPPARTAGAWLLVDVDGERRVDLGAADFFALGEDFDLVTRSLLLGRADDGWLYSYFPVPFHKSLQVRLQTPPGASSVPVPVETRVVGRAPPPGSGRFGTRFASGTVSHGQDEATFLSLSGSGKWVGLFARLGAFGAGGRGYLEGDERVYVDGAREPAQIGTGVEDFFAGGFYFDHGPFSLALHGLPRLRRNDAGEDEVAAYRLLLADAVPFAVSLRASLEAGATGDLPLRYRIVTYVYDDPDPRLELGAVVDVGVPETLSSKRYEAAGISVCEDVKSLFPGNNPVSVPVVARVCSRPDGISRFQLPMSQPGAFLRLRRTFTAGTAGQGASVRLNGILAGRFPPVSANPFRLLREADLDLPVPAARRDSRLLVEIEPEPMAPFEGFSESRWELWQPARPLLFPEE